MSALLFVLVMEALDRMISTIENRGLLSGFSMGTGVDISHLQFANDTLLFCGANLNHLPTFQSMFLLFEPMSGLQTNLANSKLVQVGNVDNVAGLILGCGVASLPLKFLNLPLGESYKAKHIWDGVIEKVC
jgi:multisubunit Na+/H+ antiporter MnhB subunit